MLSAPPSAETSIAVLAAYLSQPATNDVEKAWAVFRWIADNISYDVWGFLTKNYGDQSPEAVLARRTGVCEGYARLFEALGKAAGLGVVTIGGWARGYGFASTDLEGDTNHAWNAVKVDGGWYLFDSTWGAGYIDENQQFVKQFNPYYFLPPPGQLVYTHFPEDFRWQLLDTPITKAQFLSLPAVKSAFFTYDLGFGSHPQGTISVDQDTAITLSAPPDVLLLARLEEDGTELPDTLTFTQRRGAEYQVNAVFPRPGEYTLTVFAKKRDDVGMYWAVLEYTVLVKKGLPGPVGFPMTYKAFHERGVYLYGPMDGYLVSGSTQSFKLHVPGAEKVAVIIGQDWHHLQKNGELFEGNVPIRQGEVGVYARFPGSSIYEGLLTYTGL